MPTGAIVARRGAAQNEARRIGNERGALPDLAACSGHGESSRNEGGGARLVPQLAILRDTRKRAGARATLATGWAWFVSEAVRDGVCFAFVVFHIQMFQNSSTTAVHTCDIRRSRLDGAKILILHMVDTAETRGPSTETAAESVLASPLH